MKAGKTKQLLSALMAVLLLFCAFPALAEYDPTHPEELSGEDLTASAVILINADTGNVVFEKNADMSMFPASTTKIMTTLVALEMMQNNEEALRQICYVSESAVNLASDESSARLKAGDQVPVIDLLYGAMLPSGNDAANAIAENLGGTADFVARMNQKARELGCTSTQFVNPHGLHDERHYTTARDMARIAQYAMQNPLFRQIISASTHAMAGANRTVSNRNDFINANKTDRYYVYGTGIKTGSTSAAGSCFVGSATKDGINLISVVFGSSNDLARYTDTMKLMEYGFSQFLSITIAELYLETPRVIDIARFDLDDPLVGRLTLNLQTTPDSSSVKPFVLSQHEKAEWIQQFYRRTITEFSRDLVAPIEAGEVMGTLTYYQEDGTPVIYELVASRSIAVRANAYPTLDEIITSAENDPSPFPRITFELVFKFVLLPIAALVLLIVGLKKLCPLLRHKRRPQAFKPKGRYYQ